VTQAPDATADEARVFLVDDHKVVRTGLAAYLSTEPGMTVVGEADNGKRALDELACSWGRCARWWALQRPSRGEVALTPEPVAG
jgi:hypothetical protein